MAVMPNLSCQDGVEGTITPLERTLPRELIDTFTRCLGMHCCPAGYGMRGLHRTKDELLCRATFQPYEDCFIDHVTYRNGAHACPTGTYMRGIEFDRDLLTCCFDRQYGYTDLGPERDDAIETDFEMPACSLSSGEAFMTGFDPDENRLLCSPIPDEPQHASKPIYITLDPEAPRTFSDFVPRAPLSTWQAAVRNWLSRMFDLPVDGSYLTAPEIEQEESVEVEGGVTRKRLSYPSLVDGETMSAYLLLPPGYNSIGSYGAVIVMHGHTNSAKEANASDWDTSYHASALYLAQHGFVTLAPDTRTFGDYKPLGQDHDTYFETAKPNGHLGALPRMNLLDNLRHVSVLASIDGVRQDSIYAEGLSLGSHQAMWLAALDTRIAKVIPAGLFMSFACLHDPALNHSCQAVPSLSTNYDDPSRDLLLDTGDLAALIAPRPLYALWGSLDSFLRQTPKDSSTRCSKTAIDAAQTAYDSAEDGSRFSTSTILGMKHELDTTTALEFFSGSMPEEQMDYGTQCNDMHCCPKGKAMSGFHASRKDFVCRDMVSEADETCIVDGSTFRMGMRACPSGMYVHGFDSDQDLLTCCSGSSGEMRAFDRERVDPEDDEDATISQGIHVCPPSASTVTGIDVENDRLLCAPR